MNINRIIYTIKHKVAFLKVEKQLTGRISRRGLMHDMDKLRDFIFTFDSVEKVKKRHRWRNQHHHFYRLDLPREVYVEMMIDWECSALTKPDKPKDAYQFLTEVMPHLKPVMMPLLKEYGLLKGRKED